MRRLLMGLTGDQDLRDQANTRLKELDEKAAPVKKFVDKRVAHYDDKRGPGMEDAFATSKPGEPLADFKYRLSARDHYSHTRGLELVLDGRKRRSW
jgi:hypothetical protein